MCLPMNDVCWDSVRRGGQYWDNHTMIDHERGNYSESGVRSSGDWCHADPASMRDCKASHRGG